jgi:23S rRNA (uracil-5-)-methyltransferase RumA
VLRDLAENVARGVSEVAGIWVHLNDTNSNTIFLRDDETGKLGVKPLEGKETIEEVIGGVTYRIGPGDFFQTNPATAEILYARTIERLELTKEDSLVDLYCGVGGFALQAASKVGYVVGVEEMDGAVLRARNAARYNRLQAEFVSGRVTDVLPDLAKRLKGVGPIVTVNPARRGLERGVIEQIMALEPKRIAYVSCHPTALARDLRIFRDLGMEIGDIEMFDMFPNTPHVECLVILDAPHLEGPTRRGPRRKVVR